MTLKQLLIKEILRAARENRLNNNALKLRLRLKDGLVVVVEIVTKEEKERCLKLVKNG